MTSSSVSTDTRICYINGSENIKMRVNLTLNMENPCITTLNGPLEVLGMGSSWSGKTTTVPRSVDLVRLWLSTLCPYIPPTNIFVPKYILMDGNMLSHFEIFTGYIFYQNLQSEFKSRWQTYQLSHSEQFATPSQVDSKKAFTDLSSILSKSFYCQDLLNHIINTCKLLTYRTDDSYDEHLTPSFYRSDKKSIANLDAFLSDEDYSMASYGLAFSHHHLRTLKNSYSTCLQSEAGGCFETKNLLYLVDVDQCFDKIILIPYFGNLYNYGSLLRNAHRLREVSYSWLNMTLSDILKTLVITSSNAMRCMEASPTDTLDHQCMDLCEDDKERETTSTTPQRETGHRRGEKRSREERNGFEDDDEPRMTAKKAKVRDVSPFTVNLSVHNNSPSEFIF